MATEEQEKRVKSIVIDDEYATGLTNNEGDNADFEAIIDMLECERTEKNADWRSDIFIPQFFSQIISEASGDAVAMFQNRDYTETFVMDGTKTKAADAAERAINRTLNQKHLYHYQKYMRARMITYMKGEVVARLTWEKKTVPITRTEMQLQFSTTVDVFGEPLIHSDQRPGTEEVEVEVEDERVITDRFNYDIVEPRNVITDNTYAYSLQEKASVILRYERSFDQLEAEADDYGYVNLDKLLESTKSNQAETDTSRETYNKKDTKDKPSKSPVRWFDKIERYGKFWVVVTERYADGYPKSVEPGFNDRQEKKKNAEYIEVLITFAKSGSTCVMIGFQPQRCRDATGAPYRPLVRGLQFIHPTEDSGIGDGKPARELQVGLNDSINLGNDRTLFATMPQFKRKKIGNEDMATVDFHPGAIHDLDDVGSLQEMVIEDNIQGTMMMAGFFQNASEKALAQSPSTMGMLPQDSSVTATAIAGADSRTNERSGYKGLTFENTYLSDFYWMVLQLTWQYAEEETAMKLFGDMAQDFEPDGDFYYKPVSQAIETEYSRSSKIKNLLTAAGYVANTQNPKTPMLLNFMMSKMFMLMGDEYETFAKFLLDEQAPVKPGPGVANESVPASNQANIAQSEAETGTREAAIA